MLLLIQRFLYLFYPIVPYLHSTMLLLIPRYFYSIRREHSHLHSTMLLLILFSCIFIAYGTSFTFHYASTYTLSSNSAKDAFIDLHSTMLLLIPYSGFLHPLKMMIYIPLCFYLYGNKGDAVARREINLHSTMLLLIRPDDVWPLPADVHLHSTMLLLIQISVIDVNFNDFIYIPLCFYLYWTQEHPDKRCSAFTFHYASTYTAFLMQ